MFKCQFSDCEKLYSTKYNLQRHWELKHLETKRFRCLVCGKCLSSKQNLSEHSYTHSLAKPYLCKELMCGMAFRQNSQLSNHKKLHKELKKILNNSGEFKELKVFDM